MAAGAGFSPRDVPEVAAGYFWDAAAATGLGTTGFKVPEGNGHSTFDLIQTTVANQPTALSEGGGAQFRMRNSGNANPSTVGTAAAVTAGWTGATYVAGWFRLPDASGDITSFVTLLGHSGGSGARRFQLQGLAGTPDLWSVQTSTSNSLATAKFDNASFLAGAAWVWGEAIFDPALTLGGSVAADRNKLFANLAAITRNSNTGTIGTTLDNSSVIINVASAGVGFANSDTTDWAAVYYGNGIPARADRVRLANFRNPSGVLLT
jgi:hypothetical protein